MICSRPNISVLNPSDVVTKYPVGGSTGFVESILPYLHEPTDIYGISFNGQPPWSRTAMDNESYFVPIGRLRYPSAFPLRIKALALYWKHRGRILENSGGVLYAHAPECALPFLLFRGSVPLVYHQHGSGNPLVKGIYPWARNRILIWAADVVQRLIHKKADWIIAIDRACYEQACQNGAGHKVTLLRNAVDNKVFFPNPEAGKTLRSSIGISVDSKLVLFVGRLEEVKRVDRLIDSVGILGGSREKYRLWIVGDGSLTPMLQDRVRSERLEDTVLFTGAINHEQLPKYYNAADVLVLPSEMEGVPMVLLESIACGTPVVASRVGGISEFVIDGVNGYSIEDTTVSNFSRYIEKAISETFGRHAVSASIADFSAEKIASDLENLFLRLRSEISR